MSPDDRLAASRDATGAEDRAQAATSSADDRRRHLRPWAIGAGVLIVLVTGGTALSYTPLFAARTLQVEGERHLSEGAILRTGGLDVETNLVHLDVAVAEARLEREPWIRDAVIDVRLPSTLRVVVRERAPVMVLTDTARRLVAGDGTVLGVAPADVALPILHGAPDSQPDGRDLQAAGAVVRSMAPGLRRRVESISMEDQEVELVVDGEVEVTYGPVGDLLEKAQALLAILRYADVQDRGLLSVDVSAHAAPTARFVGSHVPITVPDPSADVASPAAPSDDDDA